VLRYGVLCGLLEGSMIDSSIVFCINGLAVVTDGDVIGEIHDESA